MFPIILLFICSSVYSQSVTLFWDCGSNCSSRPADIVLPLSISVSTTSLPFLNQASLPGLSTSISTKDLLKLLTGKDDSSYAIGVLEAGAFEAVQWMLAAPSQTGGVGGLPATVIQEENMEKVDENGVMKKFKRAVYQGKHNGIVVLDPAVNITFRISTESVPSCQDTALTFAVLQTTTDFKMEFPKYISYLILSLCKSCPFLPVSDYFFRLCPNVILSTTTTTTTTTATQPTTPTVSKRKITTHEQPLTSTSKTSLSTNFFLKRITFTTKPITKSQNAGSKTTRSLRFRTATIFPNTRNKLDETETTVMDKTAERTTNYAENSESTKVPLTANSASSIGTTYDTESTYQGVQNTIEPKNSTLTSDNQAKRTDSEFSSKSNPVEPEVPGPETSLSTFENAVSRTASDESDMLSTKTVSIPNDITRSEEWKEHTDSERSTDIGFASEFTNHNIQVTFSTKPTNSENETITGRSAETAATDPSNTETIFYNVSTNSATSQFGDSSSGTSSTIEASLEEHTEAETDSAIIREILEATEANKENSTIYDNRESEQTAFFPAEVHETPEFETTALKTNYQLQEKTKPQETSQAQNETTTSTKKLHPPTTVTTTTATTTTTQSTTTATTTLPATTATTQTTPVTSETTETTKIPTSTTVATTTTRQTTTTTLIPTSNDISARFTEDLTSLLVSCPEITNSVGNIDCKNVISDFSKLGESAFCTYISPFIQIILGLHASIAVSDRVTVIPCGQKSAVVTAPSSTVVPNFSVVYPSKVISCEKELTIDIKHVTGSGNRELRYSWTSDSSTELASYLKEHTQRTLTIQSALLTGNTSISVSGCNFLGRCTMSDPINIEVIKNKGALTVDIASIPDRITPSILLHFYVVPTFVSCNSTKSTPNSIQISWLIDGKETSYDDNLRISPYKYRANQMIKISVNVTYKDVITTELYQAETTRNITFLADPLKLSLCAWNSLVPVDRPLTIDASRTSDPNSENAVVSHNWRCFNYTDSNGSCIVNGVDWSSSTLRIPANSFKVGDSFKFTNKIESSNNLTGEVSSIVNITGSQMPAVSFEPMKNDKLRVDDYVRIQAYIQSSLVPTKAKWSVVDTDTTSFFNISSFLNDPTMTFTEDTKGRTLSVSLTIPPKNEMYPQWSGLSPGAAYKIRLHATNQIGTAFADLVIKTTTPPITGTIEFSPNTNITAISTLLTVSVGDGWTDSDTIMYRFGIIIRRPDNRTKTLWFRSSAAMEVTTYLPSADNQNASCGDRSGVAFILEGCDRRGSCRVATSDEITVAQPENLTVAMADALSIINNDFGNSNYFNALYKLQILEMEVCEKLIEPIGADKIAQALLKSLDSTSEPSEYRDVLDATARLMTSLSDNVLIEVESVLNDYRSKVLYLPPVKENTRMKRAATNDSYQMLLAASKDPNADIEKEASGLLAVYDILIAKNHSVVDVYFSNIISFLSLFCLELDAKSNRIMTAAGNPYTSMQAQTVNPSVENFLATTFSIAGGVLNAISFSPSFQSLYKEYPCNGGGTTCQHVCLGTARILPETWRINDYLRSHLFSNSLQAITASTSASALHQISLLDPESGRYIKSLPQGYFFSLSIPMTSYQAVNYYQCYIFMDLNWVGSDCVTDDFAQIIDMEWHIGCNCSTTGLLGVFSVNPPAPPVVSSYNEILITFTLNTDTLPSATQLKFFADQLEKSSGQQGRFVKWNSSKVNLTILANVTLRPPYKSTQSSNSYALQSILRAVKQQSGFVAYDTVQINSTTYSVIKRDLVGDTNARKILMTMDASFSTVVGNNTEFFATKWMNSLAATLRINPYRIKNAKIALGIAFNFTITRTYDEEPAPKITAEELSLMLIECSRYGELDMKTANGGPLKIANLSLNDIVELRVITEMNSLATILAIVISTCLLIASLYIGGAVIVKMRTERLLEEERSRMVLVDPLQYGHAPPPQYPASGVQNSEQRNNRIVRTRHS